MAAWQYMMDGPPDAPAFDAATEADAAVKELLDADVVLTTYDVLQQVTDCRFFSLDWIGQSCLLARFCLLFIHQSCLRATHSLYRVVLGWAGLCCAMLC